MSVISADAIEAAKEGDSTIWAQVGRELEDVGITQQMIREHKDFIIAWIKDAIQNGRFDEQLPKSDSAVEIGFQSQYGHFDCTQDFGEEGNAVTSSAPHHIQMVSTQPSALSTRPTGVGARPRSAVSATPNPGCQPRGTIWVYNEPEQKLLSYVAVKDNPILTRGKLFYKSRMYENRQVWIDTSSTKRHHYYTPVSVKALTMKGDTFMHVGSWQIVEAESGLLTISHPTIGRYLAVDQYGGYCTTLNIFLWRLKRT